MWWSHHISFLVWLVSWLLPLWSSEIKKVIIKKNPLKDFKKIHGNFDMHYILLFFSKILCIGITTSPLLNFVFVNSCLSESDSELNLFWTFIFIKLHLNFYKKAFVFNTFPARLPVSTLSSSRKYSSDILKFIYVVHIWYTMWGIENGMRTTNNSSIETCKIFAIHYDQRGWGGGYPTIFVSWVS